MATRAIFLMKKSENEYVGAWQWYDGDRLTSRLNRNFGSKELAEELIRTEQLVGIYTDKEKTENEKYYKNFYLENGKDYENDYLVRRPYMKLSNGMNAQLYREYEAMHNGEKSDLPLVFKSIEEARGQDVNFVYLFNENNNKWEKYA